MYVCSTGSFFVGVTYLYLEIIIYFGVMLEITLLSHYYLTMLIWKYQLTFIFFVTKTMIDLMTNQHCHVAKQNSNKIKVWFKTRLKCPKIIKVLYKI